jgi:hypothetical protein
MKSHCFFSHLILIFLTVSLFLACMTGCGGGSSGTGTRNIEGAILDNSGDAITNATVTIGETLEITVTDEKGYFSFNTPAKTISLAIILPASSHQLAQDFQLASFAPSSQSVSLIITLDPSNNSTAQSRLEVSAMLLAPCQNLYKIDPANPKQFLQIEDYPINESVEEKILCQLSVVLRGINLSSSSVPVSLEAESCFSDTPPLLIDLQQTDINGMAILNMPIINDNLHCSYTLRTQLPELHGRDVAYSFITVRKQLIEAAE